MIGQLKSIGKSVIDYLGEAKHRRFVAVVVTIAALNISGEVWEVEHVTNVIEIIVGGVAGAWSSSGFITRRDPE